MVVCLSGLTNRTPFDAVDDPATLSQSWRIWKDEFEFLSPHQALHCDTAASLSSAFRRTRREGNLKNHSRRKERWRERLPASNGLSHRLFTTKEEHPYGQTKLCSGKACTGERMKIFVPTLSNLTEIASTEKRKTS